MSWSGFLDRNHVPRVTSGSEYGRRDHAGPQSGIATLGRRRDRQAFDDHLGMFVELPAFVPGGAGIELYTGSRGQHRGSDIFGIIPALISRYATPAVLSDITLRIGISRPCGKSRGPDLVAAGGGSHDAARRRVGGGAWNRHSRRPRRVVRLLSGPGAKGVGLAGSACRAARLFTCILLPE